MKKVITDYLNQASMNFKLLDRESNNIEKSANIIIKALKNNNKIIFCGNGGSAADSQHLAAELMGRYKLNRDPLAAMSLTVDTSAITAIGNDYGYDKVFSRQLEGIGNKNDVLYATSTSGASKNVIEAAKKAKDLGIYVIGVTGENNAELSDLSDVSINAPSKETNHIQEMHIAIGQLICGIVENYFFEK
ncbi:MAG: SIS domain-containing protein [Gammaproteobacteria bacterium]|jgi:D-sedoheptulose 7-phosphate isomerase|nr:SIS domain-containing protein [Gammaproteobacteria bacterium]MBT7523251.1 SIS domain-containing protein [Gammaproteobacteria bacterium]